MHPGSLLQLNGWNMTLLPAIWAYGRQKNVSNVFFPNNFFIFYRDFPMMMLRPHFEGPKFHQNWNFWTSKLWSEIERPKSYSIWSRKLPGKIKVFCQLCWPLQQQQQFKSWGFCQVYKVLDNRAIGSWMKQQFEHEIKDLLSYSPIRGGSQAFWFFLLIN